MRPGACLAIALAALLLGFRAGQARQAASAPEPATRFAVVDVWVDPGGRPLAAWQVAIAASGPTVRVVGIEGGAHPAFAEPPFYDERAMMRDRVVIAAFSTAAAAQLPHGRTRVATIHLHIAGDGEPEIHREVQAAAAAGGDRLDVALELQMRSEP
jgi:hypothetical protein